MLRFHERSIKKKLVWMSMVASGSALLVACSAFFLYEWMTFRAALVRSLSIKAEIVGLNAASALLFNDPSAANETLSTLGGRQEIISAGLYTRDGQPFAAYHRDGQSRSLSLPDLPPGATVAHRFAGRRLVVVRPVVFKGETIGRVHIESDMKEMDERMESYAGIVILALSLSFGAALLISSRLQTSFSQPILRLAETAAVVSRDKNYSVRAEPGNRDEIGLLIGAFNEMLDQIQQRDAALQEARDDLEKRIEERTAELAATNKELETFTYSVSHDLRAPLRHVSGFSRILLEDHATQLNPDAQHCVSRVQQGVEQMGLLVDDLLNLSRISRQELRRQITGLTPLVEQTVQQLSAETQGRPLEWRLQPLPFADCDPGLTKQVFANLLSNAVKFTRTRSPAVIEVGADARNGEPVFFVRDNGVGFPMKYAGKLFGVFQRLHRQEDFEGTGVGLAIVHRILTKHGGRIWAEGELDKGATFFFTLGATESLESSAEVNPKWTPVK